ncbi:MAG TPA: pantetheine-phosphate adenylyltransferase [Myxococcota bacterium]|nr:pantetheine-phosphate adenylyltransferase [Myxococcota bacterium]
MRVTGGELGGRRLRVPASGVRPSADRVRESVFAWLGDLEGVRALDLYAGSGALGIEALSRGAAATVFVDQATASLAALRRNLADLELRTRARVVRGDVVRALRRLARERARFDLVFADPPYASDEAARLFVEPSLREILAPGGTLVLECGRRHDLPTPEGFAVVEERHYGDTRVVRYVAGSGPHERVPAGVTQSDRSRRRMSSTRPEHRIALFPASFDPVTNGHLDIVRRARRLFDEVVLAVAVNVEKSGCFPIDERVRMLEAVIRTEAGLRVTTFEGLTVDFAREIGARAIVRGVRAMSDFEYEFEMALMNKHLYSDVETIFMMPSQEYLYVSSSRLRELARFGRDVSEFVPENVAVKLKERFAQGRARSDG